MVRGSRLVAGLVVLAVLAVACTTTVDDGTTASTLARDVGSTTVASRGTQSFSDQPSYGNAVVDGNSGEWNLGEDLFANMYQAGKPDKPVLSKLYIRYACDTERLFVLVLTEPGWEIVPSDDDNFVKLGNSNKLVDGASGNDGTPPDFAYVADGGGWEASAPLASGSYSDLNVHAQVTEAVARNSGETSTVAGRAIPIDIVCDESSTTTSTSVPASTSTSLATTTTPEATTTTSEATTSTLDVSPTSEVATTTTDPGESTTTTEDIGGSSIATSTTTSGDSTLPWTGPSGPFGPTSVSVWLALILLSFGALLVRSFRDDS
jgi:hypothetical protein